MIEGGFGDADAAWISHGFEPGGDVHPVAVDPVALLDHIPEVHPNTKLHAAALRQLSIVCVELLLHRHRALHPIHHAGELGQGDCRPENPPPGPGAA